MKVFRLIVAAGVFCFLLLAPASQGQAISLGGLLQDAQGNPIDISGSFAIRVVYYETEQATVPLATVNGMASVSRGVFTASVQYPSVLYAYTEVWYEVAIDTDGDGIDPEDFFDTRFKIASAPSALTGIPFKMLDSHGGVGSSAIGSGYTSITSNRLHLSLCTAPPSSIQFDEAAFELYGWGSINNVGIYNFEGNLLYQTGPFYKPFSNPRRVVMPLEGMFLPSTQYFIGVTSTGNPDSTATRIRIATGGQWPYQDSGANLITTTNGEIPTQFVPQAHGMSEPLNLTLIKSQGESARRSASSLVQTDEGIPIVFPPGYEDSVTPEEYQKAVEDAKAAVKALLKKDD